KLAVLEDFADVGVVVGRGKVVARVRMPPGASEIRAVLRLQKTHHHNVAHIVSSALAKARLTRAPPAINAEANILTPIKSMGGLTRGDLCDAAASCLQARASPREKIHLKPFFSARLPVRLRGCQPRRRVPSKIKKQQGGNDGFTRPYAALWCNGSDRSRPRSAVARIGAEAGWDIAHLQQHQSAKCVAARGYDDRRRHAFHGRLQQPGAL